jgi:hypothetical protein
VFFVTAVLFPAMQMREELWNKNEKRELYDERGRKRISEVSGDYSPK